MNAEDETPKQKTAEECAASYTNALHEFEQGIQKMRQNNNRLASLVELLDSIKIEPHVEKQETVIEQDWGYKLFKKLHSFTIFPSKKDQTYEDRITRTLKKLSAYRVTVRKDDKKS